MLQVAAELGIAGLGTLFFLIGRAAMSGIQIQRLLRRARGVGRGRRLFRGRGSRGRHAGRSRVVRMALRRDDGRARRMVLCALFASVAYDWTFYYLLALATAPREILADRLAAGRFPRTPQTAVTFQEARA